MAIGRGVGTAALWLFVAVLCLLNGRADPAEAQLINLSTRGFVGTSDNVLIGGFVIQGGAQTVLVRVPGPSLARFGVANVLGNPSLELFSGQTRIAANDDWQTAANAASIPAALQPADPLEPAILTQLNAGQYTAVVRGVGGTTGVALVEVFSVNVTDTGFSGRWRLTLPVTSNSCGVSMPGLSDVLVVGQNGQNITASASNGGVQFAGTVNSSGDFSLTQTNPQVTTAASCTFQTGFPSLSGNFSDGRALATLSVRRVSGSCPSGFGCDVAFSGSITQLASALDAMQEEELLQGQEGSSMDDAINMLIQ
jgi:hypothetical protein